MMRKRKRDGDEISINTTLITFFFIHLFENLFLEEEKNNVQIKKKIKIIKKKYILVVQQNANELKKMYSVMK
jgi:hypothetical protein